ncbi:MAG: hypothetical protein ACI3XG_02005 [Faecousia sp.]
MFRFYPFESPPFNYHTPYQAHFQSEKRLFCVIPATLDGLSHLREGSTTEYMHRLLNDANHCIAGKERICMSMRVFLNRLFRRSQWAGALGVSGQKIRRNHLLERSIQVVEDGCSAITKTAETILHTNDQAVRSGCLRQLQLETERLTALLPFAASKEAAMIENALQTAQQAKDAPPVAARETENSTGITFYTVYIPTLDGRFFYLSSTDYPLGEIVRIPFGHQDKEIFGIVEKSQCFPYERTPLPMWKMKYILGKAPKPIADEYRRLSCGRFPGP